MEHATAKVRAMEFVNWLFKHENFVDDYFEGDCCTDSLDNINRNEKEYFFTYGMGLTRLVIIPNNEEFVLKLNLTFDKPCDYSASEALVYKLAQREGLEKAFAWSEKLCDMCVRNRKFPVYIMEKVDADEDEVASGSYHFYYELFCSNYKLNPETPEARDAFSCDGADSSDILPYAEKVNPWSREFCLRLDEFLSKYNINDLHVGNWGYRFTGDLVMIDYSGYGHNIVKEVASQ